MEGGDPRHPVGAAEEGVLALAELVEGQELHPFDPEPAQENRKGPCVSEGVIDTGDHGDADSSYWCASRCLTAADTKLRADP